VHHVPTVEQNMKELGIVLPEPVPVKGRYQKVVVHNGIAYVSGALATLPDPLRVAYAGVVGADLTLEEARESARVALLGILSSLAEALGGLDRVERFLHLGGYVNVAPGFTKVNHVIGGASELIDSLFGSDALAARTSIGVAELPDGASVVLDAIVAVSA
jgi:enamine deaminase RidA (YjgF/YER057c/UK114 family)